MKETKPIDFTEFPYCMNALNAAFHRIGIDPASMTIVMPFKQWWELSQILQSKFPNLLWFDGKTDPKSLSEFAYMGIKFRAEK